GVAGRAVGAYGGCHHPLSGRPALRASRLDGGRVFQCPNPARLAGNPIVAHRVAVGRDCRLRGWVAAEEIALSRQLSASIKQDSAQTSSSFLGRRVPRGPPCWAFFAGPCGRDGAVDLFPYPRGGHRQSRPKHTLWKAEPPRVAPARARGGRRARSRTHILFHGWNSNADGWP